MKKVKGGPDKETQAGAPAPVKGAIFYNDLLEFKKSLVCVIIRTYSSFGNQSKSIWFI